MDNEVNYTYDAKFEGNILVVQRTGCGKKIFVQNLEKIKLLVTLKKQCGYRKYLFTLKEETILETVLSIKK